MRRGPGQQARVVGKDAAEDLLRGEAVGTQVSAGQIFAEIESVKAASDLYAPVAGEVVAVNEKLVADPSPVADDPYGAGWMVKIKVAPGATLDHLLTAGQYQQQIASEEQ